MRYVFDTFVIDAAKRELIAAGTPLRVEPKVLDLLLYLIERRDRVVSKDELVNAVWQGRFISDAAIKQRCGRSAGAQRRWSRTALSQDGARARLPVRGLARGGGIGGIERGQKLKDRCGKSATATAPMGRGSLMRPPAQARRS